MEKVFILIYLAMTRAASIKEKNSAILQYSNNNDGSGTYLYSFKTSDGTKKEEYSSFAKSTNPENGKLYVTGTFSYIGPDSVTYEVQYIADENGFHPMGKHFPMIPSTQPVHENMLSPPIIVDQAPVDLPKDNNYSDLIYSSPISKIANIDFHTIAHIPTKIKSTNFKLKH